MKLTEVERSKSMEIDYYKKTGDIFDWLLIYIISILIDFDRVSKWSIRNSMFQFLACFIYSIIIYNTTNHCQVSFCLFVKYFD